MPLSPDYVQQLQNAGYVSAAQAANPGLIPTAGNDVDWDSPQFSGLHPLANNAMDQAAQAAAAPDLSRGTNAAGQVNVAPAPAPVAPAPPVAAPSPAAPPAPPQGIGATPGSVLGGPPKPAPGSTGLSPQDYLALAKQGQGGAPRPAGWSPAGRTTEGIAYSPETLGAIGQQLQVDDATADAQVREGGLRGTAQGMANQILEKQDVADADAAAQMRASQQQELKQYHDHIQSLMTDADRAGKIDPNRFWTSKSTGQKIGIAIAAALGGFGGALTHQGNPVMEMLQKQIDNDIDAQKADAQSKRSAVTDATNLYQLNRQRLGDDERATLATQAAHRQIIASQLGRVVDDVSAPATSRLRAMQLQQQLVKQRADILKELDEKTLHQTTTEKFHEASSGGAGDPLAVLKRATEIKKLDQELKGTDLGTRKGEAEIGKTEAEIAATQQRAGAAGDDKKKFELQAQDLQELGSNSFWEHPLDATVLKHFQNTDADRKELARQAYNSGTWADVIKTHPGLARNKEALQEAANVYMIEPTDTEKRIRQKIALRRQNLAGAAPGPKAFGVPDGITPDTLNDDDTRVAP